MGTFYCISFPPTELVFLVIIEALMAQTLFLSAQLLYIMRNGLNVLGRFITGVVPLTSQEKSPLGKDLFLLILKLKAGEGRPPPSRGV